MKKILFITSRNILENTGERNLIINREIILKNKFNIETDYIVYRFKKYLDNREISENINILRNPYDIVKLKKLIKSKLLDNDYRFVVISGEILLWLIPFIKNICNVKVIVDIHGTIEELCEFKSSSVSRRILEKLYYWKCTNNINKYIRYADGIIVVSQALKKYMLETYKGINCSFFTVPCSTTKNYLNNEEYYRYRSFYRKKYNISEQELIFIYSGGSSKWQCIEDAIDLYEKIKNIKLSRMLILTRDEKIIDKYGKNKNYIIDYVKPEDVTKVLCVGDYGFLLRKDYLTNRVAYPNKFLEYVQSGLKLISTYYIEDISKEIEEYSLGVLLRLKKSQEDLFLLKKYINNYNKNINFIKRNELLNNNSFEKTLSNLIKVLEEDNE